MVKKCIMLCAGLMLIGAPVRSDFEITPIMGFQWSERLNLGYQNYSSFDLEDGMPYGLILSAVFEENFALEFYWHRINTELKAKNTLLGGSRQKLFDMNVDRYLVNIVGQGGYYDDAFRPFFLFSLGATHFHPIAAMEGATRTTFGIGGGIKYYFNDTIGIRLQGNLTSTYINSGSTMFYDSWGYPYYVYDSNYMEQFDMISGIIFRF